MAIIYVLKSRKSLQKKNSRRKWVNVTIFKMSYVHSLFITNGN